MNTNDRKGLNRTRVELKRFLKSCMTSSYICLNRTRVELKLRFCVHSQEGQGCLNRTRVELKHLSLPLLGLPPAVWIEPEWNWNSLAGGFGLTVLGLNRTRVELKREWTYNVGRACGCLNRTRVELKRGRDRGYCLDCGEVWIEPEWNWNRMGQWSMTVQIFVWIEPEWNWNPVTNK